MEKSVNNKKATIFIGLGSNLNNKVENIKKAIIKIKMDDCITIEKVSSFYISEPWGNSNLDNFVNAVIKGKTTLSPDTLFQYLKQIEHAMGRIPWPERFGSRNIDLDLLFYDDINVDQPDLKIPHAEISAREFVLVPLLELEPDLIHPQYKKPLSHLYDKLKNTGKINGGKIIKKISSGQE